jgi:hypothetical protein
LQFGSQIHNMEVFLAALSQKETTKKLLMQDEDGA